jgi:hypothetical protein
MFLLANLEKMYYQLVIWSCLLYVAEDGFTNWNKNTETSKKFELNITFMNFSNILNLVIAKVRLNFIDLKGTVSRDFLLESV